MVVTEITVFSSFGYCRIGKLKPETAPIRRMSRLTTVDSTGRRMKRSVKVMASGSIHRGRRWRRELGAVAWRDGRTIKEDLVLAQGDDPLARFDPAQNGDAIAE